jgi:hypothetical protein
MGFTPRKEILYPLYRRLGGHQVTSGWVRKISPSPGFYSRTVQSVASRYTDYTIAAHIIIISIIIIIIIMLREMWYCCVTTVVYSLLWILFSPATYRCVSQPEGKQKRRAAEYPPPPLQTGDKRQTELFLVLPSSFSHLFVHKFLSSMSSIFVETTWQWQPE